MQRGPRSIRRNHILAKKISEPFPPFAFSQRHPGKAGDSARLPFKDHSHSGTFPGLDGRCQRWGAGCLGVPPLTALPRRLPFVLPYASHLYRSTFGKILVVVVTGMFPKYSGIRRLEKAVTVDLEKTPLTEGWHKVQLGQCLRHVCPKP